MHGWSTSAGAARASRRRLGLNSGLLLATRDVSGFLDRAAGQVRLRARATALGDTIIQDEFDLLEMVVTSQRVRLRDRVHREGPRELVCGR